MQNMTITVSGEKLARDLGVPHSTLVRWVEKLRHAGAEIRGELFTGYRLTRLPDVLLPQLIRPRLRTATLGRTLYHFYKVDSTNAFALRLITSGRRAPDGTAIISETQTAGRGRLGRKWHSEPESGLYFSVIVRPKIPPTLAPLVTLGAAVAMHNAVERETNIDVDIKWPNDLLAGGKKMCGILSELQAEVDMIEAMVVGVGLNVNHVRMPPQLRNIATSLRIVSGSIQSRIEILLAFFEEFESLQLDFEKHGPPAIIDMWTTLSSFAEGRTLQVHDGARVIEGRTRGLNRFGALRIEQKDGKIEEVYSGDVVHWE